MEFEDVVVGVIGVVGIAFSLGVIGFVALNIHD